MNNHTLMHLRTRTRWSRMPHICSCSRAGQGGCWAGKGTGAGKRAATCGSCSCQGPTHCPGAKIRGGGWRLTPHIQPRSSRPATAQLSCPARIGWAITCCMACGVAVREAQP